MMQTKKKTRNVDYTKQITLLTTNEQNETQLRCAFFIQLLRSATIELIERKLLKYFSRTEENECVLCNDHKKCCWQFFIQSHIFQYRIWWGLRSIFRYKDLHTHTHTHRMFSLVDAMGHSLWSVIRARASLKACMVFYITLFTDWLEYIACKVASLVRIPLPFCYYCYYCDTLLLLHIMYSNMWSFVIIFRIQTRRS